jgi:hypothetical protein
MKKLLLLFISMFFVAISFAQELVKVKRMTTMTYDRNKEEWVDGEYTYPSSIYVMIKGSNIIITSAYEQKIYTYGSPEKTEYPTHNAYIWSALDKKGDKLKFIIKIFNTGDVVYMFLYNGIGVEYLMDMSSNN